MAVPCFSSGCMGRRRKDKRAKADRPAAPAEPRPRRTHDLILAIVETDRTFTRVVVRDQEVWGGKCIHCKAHLYVGLDGRPVSRATIEHILPRTHGGTDDLQNLALACARCNHQKGCRLDNRAANDPDLSAMVQRLRERRMERWREAPLRRDR